MYNKEYKRIKCQFRKILYEEGESIEEKMRKVTASKEPIENSAPLIWTDRKDGVLPQYDIRTDRWDIAQQAMDKITASEIARQKQQDTSNLKEKDNETTGNQESANAQA